MRKLQWKKALGEEAEDKNENMLVVD